jgi:Kdo2-lipid IVA lauroyltransferase/acyltransferase
VTHPRLLAEWLVLKAVLAHFKRGDIDTAWMRMRRLARVARWVDRTSWKWALRNLQLVFGPQLDDRARSRLALIAWEQHIGSYLEGLRHSDVSVRYINEEVVGAALSLGRGVIISCVHIGSWEPTLRFLVDEGIPHAVLYRKAANPLSEREFQTLRASYGSRWLDASRRADVFRVLRNRQVLVTMTDLNTKVGGVAAEFLGMPAMCPPGPAKLAISFGCPIVPVVGIRDRDGAITCHVLPRIDPPERTVGDEAVRDLTRAINATFEPWIIEFAEQYNWFHPRWRFRPDGRVWKVSDPVETQWAERVADFPRVSDRVWRCLE